MEIITLAARFIQYQTKNKNSHHGFKNSFPFIKIHFSLAFQRFPTAGYYLKSLEHHIGRWAILDGTYSNLYQK